MIDAITEQLLLEDRAIRMLKYFVPKMKQAVQRRDIKKIALLGKTMPTTKLKSVKAWASKLPNFREKYEEAKRAVVRSNILDPQVHEPAIVAVAIVSSTTNKPCSDIMRMGTAGMPQGKIIESLIPGGVFIMPLLKLSIFILALLPFYIIGKPVVDTAAGGLLKIVGHLFALAGSGIKSIFYAISNTAQQKSLDNAVNSINNSLGTNLFPPKVPDIDTESLQQSFEISKNIFRFLPGMPSFDWLLQ